MRALRLLEQLAYKIGGTFAQAFALQKLRITQNGCQWIIQFVAQNLPLVAAVQPQLAQRNASAARAVLRREFRRSAQPPLHHGRSRAQAQAARTTPRAARWADNLLGCFPLDKPLSWSRPTPTQCTGRAKAVSIHLSCRGAAYGSRSDFNSRICRSFSPIWYAPFWLRHPRAQTGIASISGTVLFSRCRACARPLACPLRFAAMC